MSHFHIACLLHDKDIVDQFLENTKNIDVNQQIDIGDKSRLAGHTPLLLALSNRPKKTSDAASQIEMVKLLLELGADVHAVDGNGYTALHKLATCKLTRARLFPKLLM